MSAPLVISHRTNMGDSPENSLAGIDAGLRDGADGVEIDVRATRDGRLVLMHDVTLERTTGDTRPVSEVDYAELTELRLQDGGAPGPDPIPTLAEALERVAGRALLVIEVKQAGIHEAVAAEVRAADAMRWIWIWAFDPDVATACRTALPSVPVALNVSARTIERHARDADPLDAAIELAGRSDLTALSLSHALVDGGTVRRVKHRGLEVYTWTVNEPGDVERVHSSGVDAICSDFPSRVRAVVGAE